MEKMSFKLRVKTEVVGLYYIVGLTAYVCYITDDKGQNNDNINAISRITVGPLYYYQFTID